MTYYKYNGIRKLLLPDRSLITRGSLTSEDEDRARNAIKLFFDIDIIAVYSEPDNRYRDPIQDDYTNCTFAKGRVSQMTADYVYLKNSSPKNPIRISINDLVDIIPSANIKDKSKKKLTWFTFYSIDPTKPVDTYEIMDIDPVRAFMAREIGREDSLYLSRIQNLYAGMQFNTMRNN
jgi:hypothetical protein